MDTGVSTALGTALTGFKTDAMTQLADVLPIAAVVLVTVAVLFIAIRWFRALAHI